MKSLKTIIDQCSVRWSHRSVDYHGAPFRTIFETCQMLDFTNKIFLQTFIWKKAIFFPGFYIRFHVKTFIKSLIFKIFFSAWSGRLAQKQAQSVPVRH